MAVKVPPLLHKMSVSAQKAWYKKNNMEMPDNVDGKSASAAKKVKIAPRKQIAIAPGSVRAMNAAKQKEYMAKGGRQPIGAMGSGGSNVMAGSNMSTAKGIVAGIKAGFNPKVSLNPYEGMTAKEKKAMKKEEVEQIEEGNPANKAKKKEVIRQLGLKAMRAGKVDPARGHIPQRAGREMLKKEETEMNEVTKAEAEKTLGGPVKTKPKMPPGKQPAGYRYVRGLARKAMKSGIKKRDDESERMIRRAMEKEMTRMGEEVEQVEEGKIAKALAVGAMSLASMGAKAHTDTTKSVAQLAKERPALAAKLASIGATGQVPASDVRAAELQRKQDQEMPASERRAKELEKMKKEEVEQIDEGDLSIRTLYNKWADHYASSEGNSAKRADAVEKTIVKVHGPTVMKHLHKAVNANLRGDFDGEENHFERARTAAEKSGSDRVSATVGRNRSKFRKEEVEQIDELDRKTKVSYLKKSLTQLNNIASSRHTTGNKKYGSKEVGKRLAGLSRLERGSNHPASVQYNIDKTRAQFEEVEESAMQYIEEKLTAADPASKWISDFVHSDNPKFAGKSKKERIQQALGAYYAAKRETNEEVEQVDEANVKQIKKDLDSGMSHDAVIGKHANKRMSNTDEIRKVIQQHAWEKRMKKEEVESIDELEKKTLGSYVKKASGAEKPKNVMDPKNVPLTNIAAYQGDSETGHFGSRFNQSTYDKADKTDVYLAKRRGAVSAAIRKKVAAKMGK